jgi:hypothetical protein
MKRRENPNPKKKTTQLSRRAVAKVARVDETSSPLSSSQENQSNGKSEEDLVSSFSPSLPSQVNPTRTLCDDVDELMNLANSSALLEKKIKLSLKNTDPMTDELDAIDEHEMANHYHHQQSQQQQQQLVHYTIDPSHRQPVITRINLLTGEGIIDELENEIQQTISSALDICSQTLLSLNTKDKEEMASRDLKKKNKKIQKSYEKISSSLQQHNHHPPPPRQQQDRSPRLRPRPRPHYRVESSASSVSSSSLDHLNEKHSLILQKIVQQQKHSLDLLAQTKSTIMNLSHEEGDTSAGEYQQTSSTSPLRPAPTATRVNLHDPISSSPPKIKYCAHCDLVSAHDHYPLSESQQQSQYQYLEQFEQSPVDNPQEVPLFSPEPDWHPNPADADKVKTQLSAEPLPKVPIGINEKQLLRIAKERNVRLNTYDPSSGLFGFDKLQYR